SAGYNVVNSPDANLMKEKKNVSKQIVWKYSSKNNTSFFSTAGSGVQRLPNGNTLVCSMNDGHLFEVSPGDTSIVWEYTNPVTKSGIRKVKADSYPARNGVYRACRYSVDHPSLAGHDLTPGATITGDAPDYLTPADLVVQPVNTVQNVTILSGQAKCYDALETITVAGGSTTFVVQGGGSATFIAGGNILFETGVKVSSGGYLAGYITTSSEYCLTKSPAMVAVEADVEEQEAKVVATAFSIYPNPTTGTFTLECGGIGPAETIIARVYSIQGNLILSEQLAGSRQYRFSLYDFPSGLYVISVMVNGEYETIKILKIK
ncbi:MAG: T9SS type A sorting domain-containing protein, partial [Bacteroidota bacterium]